MFIELEKIFPSADDKINYNHIIFKISVDNRITYENANIISSLLQSLIAGGAIKILLNLKELKLLDSSAIGMLIKHAKQIRNNGGDIIFCNVSSEINEVISVVNLQKFIFIYKTEVEAVNKFRFLKQ